MKNMSTFSIGANNKNSTRKLYADSVHWNRQLKEKLLKWIFRDKIQSIEWIAADSLTRSLKRFLQLLLLCWMYISTEKPFPMDSPTQAKLEELLSLFDKNPNMDKSSLRNVLNQWKDMLQQLGGSSEDTLKQIEILKLLEDKISAGRRTWEPTPYEYYAFYVVVAFIISVFGKIMPHNW